IDNFIPFTTMQQNKPRSKKFNFFKSKISKVSFFKKKLHLKKSSKEPESELGSDSGYVFMSDLDDSDSYIKYNTLNHNVSIESFAFKSPADNSIQLPNSNFPINNDLSKILNHYESSITDIYATNTISSAFQNNFSIIAKPQPSPTSRSIPTFSSPKHKNSFELYKSLKVSPNNSVPFPPNPTDLNSPITSNSKTNTNTNSPQVLLSPIQNSFSEPSIRSNHSKHSGHIPPSKNDSISLSRTSKNSFLLRKQELDLKNSSHLSENNLSFSSSKLEKSFSRISPKDASKLIEQHIGFLYAQNHLFDFSHPSTSPFNTENPLSNSSPNLDSVNLSQSAFDSLKNDLFSLIIIDTRSLADYNLGHIIGAIPFENLSKSEIDFSNVLKSFNDSISNSLPKSSPMNTESTDYFMTPVQQKMLIYGYSFSDTKFPSILNLIRANSSRKIYFLTSSFEKFANRFPHLCSFSNTSVRSSQPRSKNVSQSTSSHTRLTQNSDYIDSLGLTPTTDFLNTPIASKKIKLSSYKIPNWLLDRSFESLNEFSMSLNYFSKLENAEKKRIKSALSRSGKRSPSSKKYSFDSSFNRFLQNRYPNILPYDHSRVLIGSQGYGNDYINASNVGLPNGPQYIVTQGPMKSTVSDFWLMVWEKKVGVIVMLGDLIENNQEKSYQYWPKSFSTWGRYRLKEQKNQPQYNAMISVRLEAETEDCNFPDIKVRLFRVRLTIRGIVVSKARLITQIHYKGWADNQSPPNSHTFLRAIYLSSHALGYTTFNPSEDQQIVVHCSAGCGRSGVFCTVDTALRLKKGNNPVVTENFDPLYSIVSSMRRQRMGIVQNLDQFIFCYQAILQAFSDTTLMYPHLDVLSVSVEQLKLVSRWNLLRSKIYPPDSAHMVWIMVAFMEIASELRIIKSFSQSKHQQKISLSTPRLSQGLERPSSTFGYSTMEPKKSIYNLFPQSNSKSSITNNGSTFLQDFSIHDEHVITPKEMYSLSTNVSKSQINHLTEAQLNSKHQKNKLFPLLKKSHNFAGTFDRSGYKFSSKKDELILKHNSTIPYHDPSDFFNSNEINDLKIAQDTIKDLLSDKELITLSKNHQKMEKSSEYSQGFEGKCDPLESKIDEISLKKTFLGPKIPLTINTDISNQTFSKFPDTNESTTNDHKSSPAPGSSNSNRNFITPQKTQILFDSAATVNTAPKSNPLFNWHSKKTNKLHVSKLKINTFDFPATAQPRNEIRSAILNDYRLETPSANHSFNRYNLGNIYPKTKLGPTRVFSNKETSTFSDKNYFKDQVLKLELGNRISSIPTSSSFANEINTNSIDYGYQFNKNQSDSKKIAKSNPHLEPFPDIAFPPDYVQGSATTIIPTKKLNTSFEGGFNLKYPPQSAKSGEIYTATSDELRAVPLKSDPTLLNTDKDSYLLYSPSLKNPELSSQVFEENLIRPNLFDSPSSTKSTLPKEKPIVLNTLQFLKKQSKTKSEILDPKSHRYFDMKPQLNKSATDIKITIKNSFKSKGESSIFISPGPIGTLPLQDIIYDTEFKEKIRPNHSRKTSSVEVGIEFPKLKTSAEFFPFLHSPDE
ncbi:hypothetical protein BB560_004640, partial [Smittium megazygosporum]